MQVKKQQLELDMEQQTGSKLGKECVKAAYCHGAYLYAEYIMLNNGLDEAQVGIKTAGRNINNLRCADDTILMAESEEELNSTFRKLRSWHLSHHFMANRWGNSGRLYSFGLQNHCRW